MASTPVKPPSSGNPSQKPGPGQGASPDKKPAADKKPVAAKAAASAPAAAGPDIHPDELVQRASGQRGVQAADLLQQAATLYRQKGDIVSAVHALERGLAEIEEQIESPPAARLGATLEFDLGALCEEELGRVEEALLHYQRAFKLRPDSLEPLRRGRLIYQSLGDMDMVSRLIELHLSNLGVGEAKAGVQLALELGQLKLRLNDPAGAVEVLRQALRIHNESAADEEVPQTLLATLAEAYVSPEYQPGVAEKDQARRNASDIYLGLAKRYLDPELARLVTRAQGEDEDEALASLDAAASTPSSPPPGEAQVDNDKKAIGYLRKALEADLRNVTAASLLEALYQRAPEPQRTTELLKLYKGGARVPRRGPKLLKLMEQAGHVDPAAVIDACRAGLETVSSVDEWKETRTTLVEMLQRGNDLLGLAALKEEEALEAALPEERAELVMQAADSYQRGGDQERYIACLKQAFNELPLHTEAFRKLSDFYKSRRDFLGLAVIQENRLSAQFETARIDLQSYSKQLEELAELYEKKLQDVVSAAAIWRRIDELLPSIRSQSERKRLGQRLSRIDMQVSELQIELERTAEDDPARIELLRKLAQLYRELHEPKHAATVYEQLLILAPSDLPSIRTLIELREQAGDVAGQLELLRQQVSVTVDKAERLGLLRRMMTLSDQLMLRRDESTGVADIEMTIWVCRSFTTELPSDRDALRRLSEALQLLGNKIELLDVMEAYLKVAPTPREKLQLHRRIAKVAEDNADLARAVSHLERAVRICPPGPESEEVLTELARIYGRQGRTELAVQTLDLCLKQNPRAGADLYRALGRVTLQSQDPVLSEKSVKAFREVLSRQPEDTEALSALQKLHHMRSEWVDLEQVLRRLLKVTEPPLSSRERLTVALELAEVLGQHLHARKQAAELLEQVQAESPVVDLRVHRHLRGLYEDLGDYASAARYAERELLLTDDPVARVERAIEIAKMWQVRAKDAGRALLAYERSVRIAPELPVGTPEGDALRLLVVQALEAMSQMFAQAEQWQEVVLLGQKRLNLVVEQEEALQAASILIELAQVYEEKLFQPSDGFALRRQAFEIAPHMFPLDQLAHVAERYGQWQPLCELHVSRVEAALGSGAQPPLDSVLAAARIYQERLREPTSAFKLMRRALPITEAGAYKATTEGDEVAQILGEMNRLVRGLVRAARRDEDSEIALDSVTMTRDLISAYRGLADELVRNAPATEATALRLHRLLGDAARLKDEVLRDPAGALAERMHAFSVGGERDHSSDPKADAVFRETIDEIHRLALSAQQIKEAVTIDARRLERADSEVRRQLVACESAAWLDEHGGDPQRALRACIKALGLCAEGSDAQADLRGRLFRLGQRVGILAWDEIARAERVQAGTKPQVLRQRLLYLAAMWQHGAGETVRAIDAAGQAFRLTYFPGGLPGSTKNAPPPSELLAREITDEVREEQRAIRAVLDRIAASASSDSEGTGKVVALLDNLATQLTEAGAPGWAAQVAIEAGGIDEKRNRLGQAERRYQEALKQPETMDVALQALERIYRQQRRLSDLAALIEKRRPLVAPAAQRHLLLELAEVYREINKFGPAQQAVQQALAIDDSDGAPYMLMARLYESQRTFTRAVEAYEHAAQRAKSAVEASKALLSAAELYERKLNEPAEAIESVIGALRRVLAAFVDLPIDAEEADPQLIEQRDLAWAQVERLLNAHKRGHELSLLLLERLRATPPWMTAERTSLLTQRLAHLSQDRTPAGSADRATVDAQILETLGALVELRPEDDALLDQYDALLQKTGQLQAARDAALRRAQSASERGVADAILAERWLLVGRRELDLDNLAGARSALTQAQARNPASPAILQALVELYQRAGDAAGQVGALTKLAECEQEVDEAVATLRQAAQVTADALGDAEEARRILLNALSRAEQAVAASRNGTQLEIERAQRALQEVLLPLFDVATKDGDQVAAQSYAQRALATAAVPAERAAKLHDCLGQAALQSGEIGEAIEHLSASLQAVPGQLDATRTLVELLQPRGEHERIDQLLGQMVMAADQGEVALTDADRAAFLRQQADARLQLGNAAGALAVLQQADGLVPGDLEQVVTLGETAFGLGEHAVALRYLSGLAVHVGDAAEVPAPLTAERLAELLDHAAQSAQALGESSGDPAMREQARHLWHAALRLAPQVSASAMVAVEERYLGLLLTGESEEEASTAIGLLAGRAERAAQAGELQSAIADYQQAAGLAASRVGDSGRAHELLGAATALIKQAEARCAAAGEVLSAELVELRRQLTEHLFDSAQRLGERAQAQAYAQELAQSAATPKGQSLWLQRGAQVALAQEQPDVAKELLSQALAATPMDLGLLTQLTPLLGDEEAAGRLPALLEAVQASQPSSTTPRGEEWQRSLVGLWTQLAERQARVGSAAAAADSYERALAASTTLPLPEELVLRRAALAVLSEDEVDRTRAHLYALLKPSPLDVELLERLVRVEEKAQQRAAAWRLQQLLSVLDPSRAAPAAVSAVPTGVKLEDADHVRIALPMARALDEVMATLWDSVFGIKAPTLEALGVAATERLQASESSPDELARAFAVSGRVLGNQRAGLYKSASHPLLVPRVMAKQPTALIMAPAWKESGRPLPEAQFLLARGLEGLRPEYILALAMPRADLARLLGLAVRSFHPRHTGKPADDVAAWKRELPYRATKRLGDLFKERADVEFSTPAWRRAVRRTLNRAALLVSGDLIAAASVLRSIDVPAMRDARAAAAGLHLRLDDSDADPSQEAEADLRDLCGFFVDPQLAPLFDKLHPR